MADIETFPPRPIVSTDDVWSWSDAGGSYLLFRRIANDELDVAFRMGSDHAQPLAGFRVGSEGSAPLLEALASWAARRSSVLTEASGKLARDRLATLRKKDARIAELEAALAEAQLECAAASVDGDRGWGAARSAEAEVNQLQAALERIALAHAPLRREIEEHVKVAS